MKTKKKRKVVQISAGRKDNLYVLCDDGTLWVMIQTKDSAPEWFLITPPDNDESYSE